MHGKLTIPFHSEIHTCKLWKVGGIITDCLDVFYSHAGVDNEGIIHPLLL